MAGQRSPRKEERSRRIDIRASDAEYKLLERLTDVLYERHHITTAASAIRYCIQEIAKREGVISE